MAVEEDKSFSSPFADRASEGSEGGDERSSLTDARVLDEAKVSSPAPSPLSYTFIHLFRGRGLVVKYQ